MIGAIFGDIVGSVYEFNNHRSKEFPLFREDCEFTDDSVMTVAACGIRRSPASGRLCGWSEYRRNMFGL